MQGIAANLRTLRNLLLDYRRKQPPGERPEIVAQVVWQIEKLQKRVDAGVSHTHVAQELVSCLLLLDKAGVFSDGRRPAWRQSSAGTGDLIPETSHATPQDMLGHSDDALQQRLIDTTESLRDDVVAHESPQPIFPEPGTPEWGKMNQERLVLIRKKLRGELTESERERYEYLQRQSLSSIDQIFPLGRDNPA